MGRHSYFRRVCGVETGKLPVLSPPHVPRWGVTRRPEEPARPVTDNRRTPQATRDELASPCANGAKPRKVDVALPEQPVHGRQNARPQRSSPTGLRPQRRSTTSPVPAAAPLQGAQRNPLHSAISAPRAEPPQPAVERHGELSWTPVITRIDPSKSLPMSSQVQTQSNRHPEHPALPSGSENIGPANVRAGTSANSEAEFHSAPIKREVKEPAHQMDPAPLQEPFSTGPKSPAILSVAVTPSSKQPPAANQSSNRVHIGSIDVHVTPPAREQTRRAAPVSTLSRGFIAPFGLRLG
jgi:hypothetical protein